MGHAELDYGDHKVLILLILDAATNRLWAVPQTDAVPKSTIQQIRYFMEELNCRPKKVCANNAFFTPKEFKDFWAFHGIGGLPLGAHTP